jgi:hypothetical protein
MCVDCVLTSPRIAHVDPDDESPPEGFLSQLYLNYAALCQEGTKDEDRNKLSSMLSVVITGVTAR